MLFISEEIFKKEISGFKELQWANRMLMYAITGVPPLYGIYDPDIRAYSQRGYDKSQTWKSREDFNAGDECKEHPSKVIVELLGFGAASFKLHKCGK